MRDVRTSALLALLLSSGFLSAATGLEVRGKNGLVTIRAQQETVSEILDRLAAETGLKLVYEGPRPAQRVSVDLAALPEAEALARLLEGLGLNYAYGMDAAGKHGVLIVSGSSAAGEPPRSVPQRPAREPEAGEDEPFTPEEEPGTPEDVPGVPPGFPPGSAFEGLPGRMPESAQANPGWGPMGAVPVPPGTGAPAGSFSNAASEPAPPSFPGAASEPAPPSFPYVAPEPAPPSFPTAASNPTPAER